jgi:hypothetical protein
VLRSHRRIWCIACAKQQFSWIFSLLHSCAAGTGHACCIRAFGASFEQNSSPWLFLLLLLLRVQGLPVIWCIQCFVWAVAVRVCAAALRLQGEVLHLVHLFRQRQTSDSMAEV